MIIYQSFLSVFFIKNKKKFEKFFSKLKIFKDNIKSNIKKIRKNLKSSFLRKSI